LKNNETVKSFHLSTFLLLGLKVWREKCEKLEKEKTDLSAKIAGGEFVDLGTLHQVKQDKHKLQKEVQLNK
jgi:hypothetical protein